MGRADSAPLIDIGIEEADRVAIAEGQEAVVRTARSVFPVTGAANDEATADLLTQRMQVLLEVAEFNHLAATSAE